MGQAYLLILIGIIFNRFNFYIPSIGIDLLPDFIGYLLTLLGVMKLISVRESPVYTLAKILSICFLLNEVAKYFFYSCLFQHVILALFTSMVLMIGQIVMYRCIIHGSYLVTNDSAILRHERVYTIIAVISILIYLYLCFFGGYLILMNLSALVETLFLLFIFIRLYKMKA